jgi:hypothetical protein
MVISPKVSTILEAIPGFAADVDGDVEKASYAIRCTEDRSNGVVEKLRYTKTLT